MALGIRQVELIIDDTLLKLGCLEDRRSQSGIDGVEAGEVLFDGGDDSLLVSERRNRDAVFPESRARNRIKRTSSRLFH
ncbi:MAG: hypothetical protein OXN44_05555 [Acidimicrobiaceae bacterium]|nr:hypothetical protein [Acidimicrobiaceae bacterium]